MAQRGEKRLLLPAGHDVDALPAAHLLAQLAAHAGLLVDLDPAQVGGEVLRRGADAVEGAHVDADAAAVAVVRMDDGERTLLALEHLGDVAVSVEDGLVGADDAACAAVAAERRLDVVRLLRIAAGPLGGAPPLPGAASRAALGGAREGPGSTPADARAAHAARSGKRIEGALRTAQRCISFRISSSRPCSTR